MEVRFSNDRSLNDALVALLAEAGFEMFEEREGGLNAYIPADKYSEGLVGDSIVPVTGSQNIRFEVSLISDRNWNAVWEENFQPVRIAGDVFIRALFHPREDCVYEIIIEPKMSFGTGHHPTTAGMISAMLGIDMEGKSVLDIGCGSGILSILASKMGAAGLVAADPDEWAWKNALENFELNGVANAEVVKGGMNDIGKRSFDIILANINRNVLLADLNKYACVLNEGGFLLLSGFLEADAGLIEESARNNGLIKTSAGLHGEWITMTLMKPAI